MPDVREIYDPPTAAARAPVVAAGEGSAGQSEINRLYKMLFASLGGVAAVVLVLLFIVGLPVFGCAPVASKVTFAGFVFVMIGCVGSFLYLNYTVHKIITNHDRLNAVLVNSLGQGFFSFGHNGICEDVYSQACVDLLGAAPKGRYIGDVLCVPPETLPDFKDWLDVLFMPDHALGFDDVIAFLPQFFPHLEKRRIKLGYKPVFSRPRVLARVVVIATDETEEFEAQELAAKRQEYVDMICRIFNERNQFLVTITHLRTFLEQAAVPVARDKSMPIMRLVHTLKAAVKHFHLKTLAETLHKLESDLRSETVTSDEEFMRIMDSGRIMVERQLRMLLDTIKDVIGQDYERRGNTRELEESALYSFALVMNVAGVKQEIVDHYLRFIVAIPIQDCFRQFERELMDLAEITGKHIKSVRYLGSNPPILLREYQAMIFALTHIGRNIIDHGIEPVVTRLAHSKDPEGLVTVMADVENDKEGGEPWLHVTITDDGGGIDPSKVRAKLAVADPSGSWRDQNDHEIIQNIFMFGVSTRDNVTELSGRGVGMDVVEREVKNLNGKIEVFSELYHGTRFEIYVPYFMSVD